jgi:hypothetical protein
MLFNPISSPCIAGRRLIPRPSSRGHRPLLPEGGSESLHVDVVAEVLRVAAASERAERAGIPHRDQPGTFLPTA